MEILWLASSVVVVPLPRCSNITYRPTDRQQRDNKKKPRQKARSKKKIQWQSSSARMDNDSDGLIDFYLVWNFMPVTMLCIWLRINHRILLHFLVPRTQTRGKQVWVVVKMIDNDRIAVQATCVEENNNNNNLQSAETKSGERISLFRLEFRLEEIKNWYRPENLFRP